MSVPPTDEELCENIRSILPQVDLRKTGVKKFVKLLSKKLGVDLKPRQNFIKQALTEAINSMESEDESGAEESSVDSDAESADVATTTKRKKGAGGLSAPKEITDALAAFLGKGKLISRTEIVKMLWEYIREHNLQNPENKREIFLDAAMRSVFHCKTFTMFTMNKYISAHVHPFKPVDLTTNTTPPKKRKSPGAKSSEKKKRKVGTQPPYRLSPALVDIVGKEILPRPQVVSELWTYIKANDLQNPSDRREILCDDKLKLIFEGKKKVRIWCEGFITDCLWTMHDTNTHLIHAVAFSGYNVQDEPVHYRTPDREDRLVAVQARATSRLIWY